DTWSAAARIPASIPDGTSNTIFFAEVYGTCGNAGSLDSGGTWGSLWADANSVWRPGYNLVPGKWSVSGYPPARRPHDQPHFYNSCDPNRPQSGRTGGLNVCMGDGSVRFVLVGISASTWATVNDPQDGGVPGNDW